MTLVLEEGVHELAEGNDDIDIKTLDEFLALGARDEELGHPLFDQIEEHVLDGGVLDA